MSAWFYVEQTKNDCARIIYSRNWLRMRKVDDERGRPTSILQCMIADHRIIIFVIDILRKTLHLRDSHLVYAITLAFYPLCRFCLHLQSVPHTLT